MTIIDTLALAASALTAIVGLFVAYQAYLGYRRNDSDRMRALAVGIVLVAVLPTVVVYGVGDIGGMTDAQVLLGVLLSQVAGLAVVYRALG